MERREGKMTTSSKSPGQDANPVEVPQDGLWTIIMMFAWPAIWYTALIYGIRPLVVPGDVAPPTWFFLAIIVLGPGAEMVAGLLLLRREGYRLTVNALQDRIRLHWPKDLKAWGLAIAVLVLGFGLSMAMGPLNRALAGVPGFVPPVWWPPASNPTVEINSAAEVFPDINLVGNFLFVLVYFVMGLVFNVFGEEVYYRGYLLPRMRGVFGKWDWVANGVLFTLKHMYQRWLYPGILVGGLAFAFAGGPLGSLPLAMIYHWVGNFLFQMIFLIMAALGVG
jgi:membrane protease YdiL (CAAX protease family)